MTKIKNFIKSLSYYQVYFIIASIMLTVFFVQCLCTNGQPMHYLTVNIFTRYDDYYMHLGYASVPIGTNIYEYSNMACFPPLAYLLYSFLAYITGFHPEDPTLSINYHLISHNAMVFLLFHIICTVFLVYAISLYIKKSGMLNRVVFPSLLILSYPITFTALQRANSIYLVVSLAAIALAWRDDESKVKREGALILIAICAGMKIYPAVLGLLYLKDKRWKETIRLIIYGVVLFFVPFAFYGGIEGFKSFFKTILWLYGEVHITSLSGVVKEAISGVFGQKAGLFATIVQQLFLILSLIAFFIVKDRWAEILLLCGLMALYVSSSWMYTCIYFLPPMLMFFRQKDDQPLRTNKKDWPEVIAFALFVFCFTIPYHYQYEVFYAVVSAILSVYILVIVNRAIIRKFLNIYNGI